MLKERDIAVRKVAMLSDSLVVTGAFFMAHWIRQNIQYFYKGDLFPSRRIISEASVALSEYFVVLILSVAVWIFLLHLNGMYQSLRTRPLFEVLWIVIKSSLFGFLFLGSFIFLFKLEFVSRLFFALFCMVIFVLLMLEKALLVSLMRYFRKRGRNWRGVLIVGTGKRACDFIERI